MLFVLLNSMRISVFAIVASNVLFAAISTAINLIPNKRLIHYGFMNQLVDLLPAALLSVVMGGVVYCISFIGLSDIVTLFIQVICGLAIYVAGSVIFQFEAFIDIKKLVFKER